MTKDITPVPMKSLGKYNLCSNEKQWCVQMRLLDGDFISQLWPEDEEPEVDEYTMPSECLEIISRQLESLFYSSKRDKDRERIHKAREQAEEMDRRWAKRRIKDLETQKERIDKQIKNLHLIAGAAQ